MLSVSAQHADSQTDGRVGVEPRCEPGEVLGVSGGQPGAGGRTAGLAGRPPLPLHLLLLLLFPAGLCWLELGWREM